MYKILPLLLVIFITGYAKARETGNSGKLPKTFFSNLKLGNEPTRYILHFSEIGK